MVLERCGRAAGQQGIGQLLHLVGQRVQHLAQDAQYRRVAGWDWSVSRSSSQTSRWSRSSSTCISRPASCWRPGRARRLQQDVAGALQLVGQRRLLPEQLADQRCLPDGWAGGCRGHELAGLGAHQAGQRLQRVGQHLHAVAGVEQHIGQRGPHQVPGLRPAGNAGRWTSAVPRWVWSGTAIENSTANMIDIDTGMPRLPQAAARKAMNVAGTSSRPSCRGSACSCCTATNSGRPISAAGSSCQNLPRRGAGWSGGMQTITPMEAADAAAPSSP